MANELAQHGSRYKIAFNHKGIIFIRIVNRSAITNLIDQLLLTHNRDVMMTKVTMVKNTQDNSNKNVMMSKKLHIPW